MFNNLPLSIIKNPAGTYSYVGSIPTVLGNEVDCTKADIMGQRWHINAAGETKTWQFPVFESLAGAYAHAVERGITIE